MFPTELGLPDYYDERYDPLWAAIQETDLPICCHIGIEHDARRAWPTRDPTPQQGMIDPMVGLFTGEALGMWILERRVRALPRPEGGVRRARARLGRVVAASSPTTWC